MTIPAESSAPQYPLVGDGETIMSQKAHGTSATGVQEKLRWAVSKKTASRICNYNRHFAEPAGSYTLNRAFMGEVRKASRSDSEATEPIIFYDSNTGYPLFQAPVGRSWNDFIEESNAHGWPSFRDEEVIWDRVRCLRDGECVSLDGTHLGHNLPDRKGNRYCINLCSVAGNPVENAPANPPTTDAAPSAAVTDEATPAAVEEPTSVKEPAPKQKKGFLRRLFGKRS